MQKAVQFTMTLNRDLDIKAVDSLFYSFHSEFEAIVMDMVADKIDRKTLEIMFADLDELQEKYHNRLDDLLRKGECP